LSINYEIEKYIKRADENPAIKRVAINFAIATIGQNSKAKLSLTQTPPRRDNCSELPALKHLGGTVATIGFPDPSLQGFSPKVLAHGHHGGNRVAVRRGG
jgi:hypothetical protein